MTIDGWSVFFTLYGIGAVIYLIYSVRKRKHQNVRPKQHSPVRFYRFSERRQSPKGIHYH